MEIGVQNFREAVCADERYAKCREVLDDVTPMTPAEFFDLRSGYKNHLQDFDFMGCYVIHNLTKNMYYVGQATHVPQRVNNHFTGKGNGDIYADYKRGNHFDIRLINIMATSYFRLDDLERDLIDAFDAYDNGYNKKRGNVVQFARDRVYAEALKVVFPELSKCQTEDEIFDFVQNLRPNAKSDFDGDDSHYDLGADVRKFCCDVFPRVTWDLLPWRFLYELYIEWTKAQTGVPSRMGKTTFVAYVRRVVMNEFPIWIEKQSFTNHRMDAHEPLIFEYGLTNWMNENQTGQKTDLQARYRGLVRR